MKTSFAGANALIGYETSLSLRKRSFRISNDGRKKNLFCSIKRCRFMPKAW